MEGMKANEVSTSHMTSATEREMLPGYKRTEVGLIPDRWSTAQLLDIADFKNGKPHEKNIARDGRYQLITLDSIGIDGNLKSEHKAVDVFDDPLQRNDIVAILSDIAHGNLLGLCDLIPSDNTYVLNQRVGRLRIKTKADPRFVRLQINRQQGHFKQRGQGTSQRHIYRRDFESLWIPYPPEPEQRAIADALSDVEGLLGALEALIAKKRAIMQAAMQQLLIGKTRLPGFDGEWNSVILGDYVTYLKTGTNSRAELVSEGPVKYLHYGDIHTSNEVRLDAQATSMLSLSKERARALDRLRTGDLVLVDASEDLEGIGKSVEISGVSEVEIVAGLHTIAARFDRSVIADGFKAYLQFCPAFRDQLNRLAAGTKVFATNRSHISSVEIRLPGIREQTAIATILSDMDAEITALERRRDKTKQIKQGMLQQLLTGRIRLVEPALEEVSE